MHGLTLTSSPDPAGSGRTVEVDGRECRTAAAFFTTVAGALALPDWFGRNWDAFEESLSDLDPPLAELRITHAEALLDEEGPSTLTTFASIVEAAPPALVLVAPPDALDALRSRLGA